MDGTSSSRAPGLLTHSLGRRTAVGAYSNSSQDRFANSPMNADMDSGHRLNTMTIHFTKIFNVTITIILIASFAIAYFLLLWAAFTE
jgi:hypothetical protein